MEVNWLLVVDVAVFLGFIIAVVTVGIAKSRHEGDSEGYFLAGRGLTWWLIGFSLIAANISTEQFVGMSGQAAGPVGLAIASYEWMAAITLIGVAFFFLPKFLGAGIFTIPEFLEYRYNHHARTIMSFLMMLTYLVVTIPAVIFSGAKTVDVLSKGSQQVVAGTTADAAADAASDANAPQEGVAAASRASVTFLGARVPINVTTASWLIGILAAVYVAAGGLKACAWADLLQGSALILGGAIVMVIAFMALGSANPGTLTDNAAVATEISHSGAMSRFLTLNHDKLHMFLPASDSTIPWTALVLGLWIPNFYYWGLNQYILQRALGAKSVGEGQKGVVFAASLKLLVPFIIVFPGMIAFNLYRGDMREDAQTGKNLPMLRLFAKHQDHPDTARMAFDFNGEFAALHAPDARAIVDFNRRVAGIEGQGKSLDEINRSLLQAIEKKNASLPPDARVAIENPLIGYDYDAAFGLLVKHLIPVGLRGFILAALLGAVISTLAAMLNAASTIFTMDLYGRYLHRNARQEVLVGVGRIAVAICVVIGCIVAPLLNNPKFGGIFNYIQEFQGFISPGILGVFIFGLFVKRAPRASGLVGLALSPAVYGLLKWVLADLRVLEHFLPTAAAVPLATFLDAFLNRMAVTFFTVLAVLAVMTLVRPLREPVTLPSQAKISLDSSATAKVCGLIVVLATVVLYILFR